MTLIGPARLCFHSLSPWRWHAHSIIRRRSHSYLALYRIKSTRMDRQGKKDSSLLRCWESWIASRCPLTYSRKWRIDVIRTFKFSRTSAKCLKHSSASCTWLILTYLFHTTCAAVWLKFFWLASHTCALITGLDLGAWSVHRCPSASSTQTLASIAGYQDKSAAAVFSSTHSWTQKNSSEKPITIWAILREASLNVIDANSMTSSFPGAISIQSQFSS